MEERDSRGERAKRKLLLARNVTYLKKSPKILIHRGHESEPFWEAVWQYITRELKMFTAVDPVNLLLGFYPTK